MGAPIFVAWNQWEPYDRGTRFGGHLFQGEARELKKTPRSKAGAASVNERGQLASGDWLMSFGKFGGPGEFQLMILEGSGPPMTGPGYVVNNHEWLYNKSPRPGGYMGVIPFPNGYYINGKNKWRDTYSILIKWEDPPMCGFFQSFAWNPWKQLDQQWHPRS